MIRNVRVRLVRTYLGNATHGNLYVDDVFICKTIELPWKNNAQNVSCIPEGVYPLKYRFSNKFRDHVLVENVPNREYILFHAANNALKELRGCIAPVSLLQGEGIGASSKIALDRFRLKALLWNPSPHKITLEIVWSGIGRSISEK